MLSEYVALLMLRADGECPEAEDRIRQLLVQLEREGVPPRQIASAQARMLLGFCAEQARAEEQSGWAMFFVDAVSALMHLQSEKSHRSWTKAFLKQAHRLYETARFQMKPDRQQPPPLPPFAVDISRPAGSA